MNFSNDSTVQNPPQGQPLSRQNSNAGSQNEEGGGDPAKTPTEVEENGDQQHQTPEETNNENVESGGGEEVTDERAKTPDEQ